MGKPSLLILLLSLGLTASAQTPGIISNTGYGGAGDDAFMQVIQLKNGNFVCSGHTNSIDGQAVGNHGGVDFFIVCISVKGQLLWRKVIGGSGDDGVNFDGNGAFVSPSDDGGFFFGGGTASMDGDIVSSKGSADAFVAKMDENGNITWKKNYGGDQGESISAIQSTPDGGCIFSATSNSDNNGDVPANHSANSDIWIVKLDATGTIQWSKMFGGSNNETATCIRSTLDGGYVFTANVASEDGDLAGTVAPGSFRRNDIWIVKLNGAGAMIWNKRFGGSDDDDGANIISASTGDYYVVASSRSVDGDFINNGGLYDIVLIKLSASGDVIFIKSYNGSAWDSGSGIAESKDGNIILSGISYSDKLDGVRLPSRGGSDGLLMKVEKSSGNIQWLSVIAGSGGDFTRSVIQSSGGETILVGESYSGDGDFKNNMGYSDAFFIKIAPYNVVRGAVYYDYNGNGIKDGAEPYVQNINVTTTKSNTYFVSGYTENGNYSNDVDSGTFVTRPRLFNSDYYTITPDSIISSFPGYYGSVTSDFGLKPIPGKRDIRSIIVALNPARAGFNSYYKLICYNAGTDTVASGKVSFYKDPRTTLLSTVPSQTGFSNDTITWSYTNFRPLDTLVFDIALSIGRPPVIHNGDWVAYKSFIEPTAADLNPGDNTFRLYHQLTGSYDPNDKEESHGGIYTPASLARKEFLTYTIRFQNTGNDTAFNVVIKDTLDQKLDWKTFDLLASSHKADLTITNNICSWNFSNILLPDSNRNGPASHGFITYRIKPLSTIQLYDTIRNNASIYFDYNEPVQTNTNITIVKDSAILTLSEPLAKPLLSNMPVNYCSTQTEQTISILNIPDDDFQATVSAKIDGAVLVPDAGYSLTLVPSQLGIGNHRLTVAYKNATDSTSASRDFSVVQPLTPGVKLTANMLIVSNLQDPVVLMAKDLNGGGTLPRYSFAKDKLFANLIQAESRDSNLTIQPVSLISGDNLFYVKMKTSDSCYTTDHAIDSIIIRKNQISNVSDSAVLVSPNPFSNELTIKHIDPTQAIYFQIYDGLGREVFTTSSIGQTSIVIHPDMGPGNYYLIIFNSKMQKTGLVKLLKK